MPIIDKMISAEIIAFMTAGQDSGTLTDDTTSKIKEFADNLAGVISNAIKSATVTVNAGIPVTTAGSPTAQTGSTTAPGTGSLS